MEPKDWNAIKAEYISTNVSYRKLAAKWKVSFRTLAGRGKRESWVNEHKKYCDAVVTGTVQKVAEKSARDFAKKIIKLQEIAGKLVDSLIEILEDPIQFKRHLVHTSVRTPEKSFSGYEDRIFDIANTSAMLNLSRVLVDLTGVIRDLYGIPTTVQQFYIDLASKRLVLDERRLKTGDAGCVEVKVVFASENIKELSQ